MNYTEAIAEVAKFQRFFRALSAIDDLLATANQGLTQIEGSKAQLADLNNSIVTAQNKYAEIEQNIADLKVTQAKAKQLYDAKVAVIDEKIAQEEGKKLEAIKAEIAAKIDELNNLNAQVIEESGKHQAAMAEYAARELTAKTEASEWEAKLAKAQAAFEKFKSGLA